MELATRNLKHAARSGRLSRSKKSAAFTGCVRLFERLPGSALADRPIERNMSAAFNGVKELWVVPGIA